MKIKFYADLRKIVNKIEINFKTDSYITVDELLNLLSLQINPIIKERLVKDGEVIKGAMILVNGVNIYHLNKLETLLEDIDTINLFPPVGCGKNLL